MISVPADLSAYRAAELVWRKQHQNEGRPLNVVYRETCLSFQPGASSVDILQTLQLVDRYNELRDRYEALFRDTVGIDLAAARERRLDAEKAPITRPATAESITEPQASPPG